MGNRAADGDRRHSARAEGPGDAHEEEHGLEPGDVITQAEVRAAAELRGLERTGLLLSIEPALREEAVGIRIALRVARQVVQRHAHLLAGLDRVAKERKALLGQARVEGRRRAQAQGLAKKALGEWKS